MKWAPLAFLAIATACGSDAAVSQFGLDVGADVGSPTTSPATYRITSAKLRDPHVFTDPPFFDCSDVTYDGLIGFDSANETIAKSFIEDKNGDSFLDFSILFTLHEDLLSLGEGTCLSNSGECFRNFNGTTTSIREAETCFEADPQNIDFEPRPRTVTAPCFVSDPTVVTFDFGRSSVRFLETTIAGQYVGERVEGIMRGYVTLTEARNARVRGGTLDEFLPGAGGCDPTDARDSSEEFNEGWWFYIEYEAGPVDFVEEGAGCCSTTRPHRVTPVMLVWILTTLWFRRRSHGRRDDSSPESRWGS